MLDRLSSASTPGDVYGTGFSSFDTVAQIHTSARFLYLYQEVNDGNASFEGFDWIAEGAAENALIAADLILTDEDGPTTLTNQFGLDDQIPSANGASSGDVVDPGLAQSTELIAVNLGLSFDDQSQRQLLTALYDPNLAPGKIGQLFGFTSNRRPIYYNYVGMSLDTPVPLPEPSVELMFAVGLTALAFAEDRRRRNRVR